MGFPDALRLVLEGRKVRQTSSGCTVWQDEEGRIVCTYPAACPLEFLAMTQHLTALDWEPVRGE